MQLTGVNAELLGMRVTGEGSLTGANELAGRIVIGEFTPNAALQALLRGAVPPTVDVAALGLLALDTRFDTSLDTGRAALRDLELRALGATVSGTIEALPGERGNVFRGEIATSRFAPDALTTAFAAMLPPNLAASELGMIELSSRFELDSAADTLTVAPLRAEAFGLRASGEVKGRNVSQRRGLDRNGQRGAILAARVADSGSGCRRSRPPTPQAFTRATIGTRFTVTKDGAELDNFVLDARRDDDQRHVRAARLRHAGVPFRARRRQRRCRSLSAAESARRASGRSDGRRHRAAAEQHDERRRHDARRRAQARGHAVRGRRQPHPDRQRRPEARERSRTALWRHVRRQLPRTRRGQRPGARARRARERHRARAVDRGADGRGAELQRHRQLRFEPRGQRPHGHRERADGRRQRQLRHEQRRDQGVQLGADVVRRVQRHPRRTRPTGAAAPHPL